VSLWVAHPLNGSKGCGDVMGMAPVGLALRIEESFRIGCELAAITHGHPSGYLAAGFLTLAIREVVRGTGPRGSCDARADRRPRRGLGRRAGAGHLALLRPRPPGRLRVGGAPGREPGGDSDSTGAIAGSLMGAHLGEGAIPQRWLAELELRAAIERPAIELAQLCEPRV
jgi:ADP-ribosylglycohydrolase